MQRRFRMARTTSLTAVLILLVGAGVVSAQTAPQSQPPAPEKPQQEATGQMPAGMMQQMMAERQKMMAEAKAMDQKLDELVAQMNAAEGPAKIDAIAAVVTEMVARRRMMRDRMMTMQGRMMQHMMSMMGGMEKPDPATEGAAPGTTAPHQH